MQSHTLFLSPDGGLQKPSSPSPLQPSTPLAYRLFNGESEVESTGVGQRRGARYRDAAVWRKFNSPKPNYLNDGATSFTPTRSRVATTLLLILIINQNKNVSLTMNTAICLFFPASIRLSLTVQHRHRHPPRSCIFIIPLTTNHDLANMLSQRGSLASIGETGLL